MALAFPPSEIHVKTSTCKTVINVESSPPAFLYTQIPSSETDAKGNENTTARVEVLSLIHI